MSLHTRTIIIGLLFAAGACDNADTNYAGQGAHWQLIDLDNESLSCQEAGAAEVEWKFVRLGAEGAPIFKQFACDDRVGSIVIPEGDYAVQVTLKDADGGELSYCEPDIALPFLATQNQLGSCEFVIGTREPRVSTSRAGLVELDGLEDIELGRGYHQPLLTSDNLFSFGVPERLARDVCIKGERDASHHLIGDSQGLIGSTSMTALRPFDPGNTFRPADDIATTIEPFEFTLLGKQGAKRLKQFARNSERARIFVGRTSVHATVHGLRDVEQIADAADCGDGYVAGVGVGAGAFYVIKVLFPDLEAIAKFKASGLKLPFGGILHGEWDLSAISEELVRLGVEIESRAFHYGGDSEKFASIVGEGLCQSPSDIASCIRRRNDFLKSIAILDEIPESLDDLGSWVRTTWITRDNPHVF